MEHEKQSCQNCQYWRPIVQEGSLGSPMKPAQGERSGWGECYAPLYVPQLVRMKGILETKFSHWCTAYSRLQRPADTLSGGPRDTYHSTDRDTDRKETAGGEPAILPGESNPS